MNRELNLLRVIVVFTLLAPTIVIGDNIMITDKKGRTTGYIKDVKYGNDFRITDKYGRTTGYIKKRNGKVFITDPYGNKKKLIKM